MHREVKEVPGDHTASTRAHAFNQYPVGLWTRVVRTESRDIGEFERVWRQH